MKTARITIFGITAVLLVATVVWWTRPLPQRSIITRYQTVSGVAVPDDTARFARNAVDAGFHTVDGQSFNSLLPPDAHRHEYEALTAYQRSPGTPTDTWLLGYHPGDKIVLLYSATSGTDQHVMAFQDETRKLRAELTR